MKTDTYLIVCGVIVILAAVFAIMKLDESGTKAEIKCMELGHGPLECKVLK